VTPEKQADDAIAIIWLCAKADVCLTVDKGSLWMDGVKGAPQAELRSLIQPYKEAIIGYLNALALPASVRRDIDEAVNAAGWDFEVTA
jgi:hypothetical protein